MGYPLTLARRYLASKKRDMISISTALAIGGVTLGVAALAIVMSVTGGFQEQFREKVLGVNAHVLVLKYSIDFREYRDIMKKVEEMYNSFGIGGKVNRGRMAAQAYKIQSVPMIVVDGKFVSNRVPSHAAMPPLIDALVAKARAERPKT